MAVTLAGLPSTVPGRPPYVLAVADTVVVTAAHVEVLTKACPLPAAVDAALRTAANDVLPLEILMLVFAQLDAVALARASQVCRAWQRVPWTRLDVARCVADIRWFKVRCFFISCLVGSCIALT